MFAGDPFMGYFKHCYVDNCDVIPLDSRIIKWYRYIDDIDSVFFVGDLEEAQEFVSVLNSFVEELEFSLEVSPSKVHFLDMWVCKHEGNLITTLYTKEIDHNTLLLAMSFNPSSLKKKKKKLYLRVSFSDYERFVI